MKLWSRLRSKIINISPSLATFSIWLISSNLKKWLVNILNLVQENLRLKIQDQNHPFYKVELSCLWRLVSQQTDYRIEDVKLLYRILSPQIDHRARILLVRFFKLSREYSLQINFTSQPNDRAWNHHIWWLLNYINGSKIIH